MSPSSRTPLARLVIAIYLVVLGLCFIPDLYRTTTTTTPSHQEVSRDDKGTVTITRTGALVTHTWQSTVSIYLLCIPAGLTLLTRSRRAYQVVRVTLLALGGFCTLAGEAAWIGFSQFTLGPISLVPDGPSLLELALPISLILCGLLVRSHDRHPTLNTNPAV
ncbi:MAG: hypothetical protein JO218_10145 [Burkholderiales bacterium]|nr:hypothetical protein [Burkholderiales bacterium]